MSHIVYNVKGNAPLFLPVDRTFLKDMWQNKWDINLKGRHLYGINKTVYFAITAPKLYRYNEILFFRLRTGYIKLNSTSHKSLWCRGCSVQLSTENIIKIY
jgi:hypothetical protein